MLDEFFDIAPNRIEVHPQQEKAWEDIVDMTYSYRETSHIVAQAGPQAGKTGLMSWGHVKYAHYHEGRGEYRVYNILADPNNVVLKQTRSDIYDFLDDQGLRLQKSRHRVENRGHIKKIIKDMSVDTLSYILVFIDEAHYAAKEGQLIDQLYKHLTKWSKEKQGRILTWIDVGATSFAHSIIVPKKVWLETNDAYNSVEHMDAKGRIQDTGPLMDKSGCLTYFLKDILDQSKKHKKITIIRTNGEKRKQADLKKLIREAYPKHKLYEADYRGERYGGDNGDHFTLDEIGGFLEEGVTEPTILFVKQGGRLGARWSLKNVFAMIDSKGTGNGDTVAQSFLGRSCGYQGKINDTHVIYCNKDQIPLIKQYYNREDCIPRGINNKESKDITGDTSGVIIKTTGHYENIGPFKNYVGPDGVFDPKYKLPKDGAVGLCTAGNEEDYARLVVLGKKKTEMSGDIRLFHMNDEHPLHKKSWADFIREFPEGKGCVFRYVVDTTETPVVSDLVKPSFYLNEAA
jgi:hypothetical protein